MDEGTIFQTRWFKEGDPIVSLRTGQVVNTVLRRGGSGEEEFYLDTLTFLESTGWVDHKNDDEPVDNVVAYMVDTWHKIAYGLGLEYKERMRRQAEKTMEESEWTRSL